MSTTTINDNFERTMLADNGEGVEEQDWNFDFSGVNENQMGEVWSNGIYPAIIEDAVFSLAKASGNPMITCTWQISDPETGKTKKGWDRLVLGETTMSRVKRTLLRIAPELIEDGRTFNPRRDAGELIGRAGQVKLGTSNYEGQVRNEIKEVLAPAETDGVGLFN